MDCRREVEVVRMVVTAVAVAMVMAENGRMCFALDMEVAKATASNSSEEAKQAPHLWTDQNSWKWVDKGEIEEGALNMMSIAKGTASDGMKHSFEKPDTVSDSTSAAKEIGKEFYNEANRKVEEAYDMVVNNGFSEAAKAKYEAAKERASDAAGEVGAKMRH